VALDETFILKTSWLNWRQPNIELCQPFIAATRFKSSFHMEGEKKDELRWNSFLFA
jgi:hypothetical protein